jgi:hypothetical protein
MIFLGEPADYDELVSMDAADATDSTDPHHVSMEDADRILNDEWMWLPPQGILGAHRPLPPIHKPSLAG